MKGLPAGRQGLTLVEVLVAMGIAASAGVLLLVVIVQSTSLFTEQSSKVSTGLNVNDSFAEIRAGIKQASIVSDQSNSGQLILRVLSVDSSNNIIENTYDQFIFEVQQKNLHFRIIPEPSSQRVNRDEVLAGNVDSLTFQYFNLANPPAEVLPQNAGKVRMTLNVKANISTMEGSLRND